MQGNSLVSWWADRLDIVKAEVKTEIQCAKTHLPNLIRLQQFYGIEQVKALLALELMSLNKMINVENIMDKEQVEFTVESILDEFRLLNLADVNLVMTRAKRGHYGKFYNRITCADVMEMFRKHFEARVNQSDEESYNNAMQFKEPSVMPDYINQLAKSKRL